MADLNAGGLIDIEIDKILNNPNLTASSYVYEVYIHTEKLDIQIDLLESIEWILDYNSNTTDYVLLKFSIQGGSYIKHIYPYRDALEATIIRNDVSDKTPPVSKRYKMVIANNQDNIEGSPYGKMEERMLNETYLFNIESQLILRNYQAFRDAQVPGKIFKGADIKSVLSYIYTTLQKELIQVSGSTVDILLNISEPDNDFKYDNFILPSGITLLDVPSYLQNSEYGVYNGNIGTYYTEITDSKTGDTKKCIFIYPLYSTKEVEGDEISLMVIHSNTSKYVNVENTYFLDGSVFKVLANNNVKNKDPGPDAMISMGSGILYSNPNSVLERTYEVTTDGLTFNSEDTIKGESIVKLKDGVEKVIYAGVNSNMYASRSTILKSTLSYYTIPWNYCNLDNIYPGMKVTFVYEDEQFEIMRLNGVLQSSYFRYDNKSKVITGMLNIMVESPIIYKQNR